MFQQVAFASKELPDGKRIFWRIHGIKTTLVANGDKVVDFVVPYTAIKINEAEVIGAPAGLTVDFDVLDTDQGHIQMSKGVPAESVVPNLLLDRFGHDVNVCQNYYRGYSPYDADLIQGMRIRMTLKNPTSSTDTIGINLSIHEVKSV